MKFWVRSGGAIEFNYRDDDDGDVCERCLSEEISGRCPLGRYAVRKTRENSDFVFCYEKSTPGKQAKFLSKIATDSFRGLVRATEQRARDIGSIQTIAFHNAKKLNASIGQKIDSLLNPKSQFLTSSTLPEIVLAMENRRSEVASAILSVRKIVEQVEDEYNLVDILDQKDPFNRSDLTRVKAHKILLGVKYNYKEVLEDRSIAVQIADTNIEMDVEYSVAKSSIGQILSNAAKYCKRNSTVYVKVARSGKCVELTFSMTSLYFSKAEASSFGNIGVRGRQTKDISGEGVGLHAVGLFQKMHHGYVQMQSIESTKFKSEGKEYSQNSVTLGFHDYQGSE